MSLKREPCLQPLSRDHLIALFHAYRLVQAASNNPRFDLATAIAGFKAAWKDEIAIHFADEERLFPELPINRPSIERLFSDHAELRDLVRRLFEPDGVSVAYELGDRLEKHVRWEEHELFPEIESSLSRDLIRLLEFDTDTIEKSRHRKPVDSLERK